MDKYTPYIEYEKGPNGRWYIDVDVDADKKKDTARIKKLEEELADYKEGTEGLKLCVGNLRKERDKLEEENKKLKEIKGENVMDG